MINLTESAIEKIQDVLYEKNDPNTRLRIAVQGGGCSGFSYAFSLDSKQEDDYEIPVGAWSVLIDSMSAEYLRGAEVNYLDELFDSGFKVHNPNATSTCGCGSSFMI